MTTKTPDKIEPKHTAHLRAISAHPAFPPRKLARPALPALILYFSIIPISLMTMVRPVNAAGTVSQETFYHSSYYPDSYPIPDNSSYDAIANKQCNTLYPQTYRFRYQGQYTPATPPPALFPVALLLCKVSEFYQGVLYPPYFTGGGLIMAQLRCPLNSTGSTSCTCNAGFQPDPTATSCVPVVACPVNDLPPITDPEILPFENNPNLSDTARLTPRMQTALSCLQTAAAAGSPSVGSAYRPPAYNQHLIDVWRKWDELIKEKNSANSACADLKAKIQGHFQRHLLLESQQPVPGSLHTLGEAVDVTISLPPASIDALAAGCQLRRPLPVKDHVHFIHQ